MNTKKFEKVFPLGSHLCREPMPPMSELKKDMENLKKHEFNLVKLQEHWAIDEPLEGHYDFSRYEELIDYAAKLNMGIYLGLTCEQAPAWLWRKYPDCRMVGRNGLPISYEAQTTVPADGKPGPCYDHPGATADQIRFIKKLVQTLGRYENIVIWNTWQEIGYWGEQLVGQPVCYCNNTLNFFRQWLKQKHGDLHGLNQAWNSRYLDWSYVSPGRLPIRKTRMSQFTAQDVDWQYFINNVQISRVLRKRAQAIREVDPLKRPIFAHKASGHNGFGVDWSYSRCQDFLGSSCYPAWTVTHKWDDDHPKPEKPFNQYTALFNEMWENVALRFDYIRSCNKRGSPVWAAEFQGGPGSSGLHKGRVPSADDIRRWMLTGLGSGMTAISFWVTRAEILAPEMNGFSLLDSEGDSTERFEEASHIGKALQKHPNLFAYPSWPGAQIAILINESNYRVCDSMPQGGEHLTYSVRGWHRLLWEAGIPVDFIEASELDEKYARDYKIIILPFPISLSESIAAKLAQYVKEGGNLISEACPGRLTEYAFCNRGELSPTACELFGVRQESLTMVKEPENGMRWSPSERTWGEYLDEVMLEGVGPLEGMKIRANFYIETFKCLGSEPCLQYREAVAGTVRKIAKGRAWLLGTFAGHNGTAYRDKESRTFIRALLVQGDVVPEHNGNLLLRKRIIKGKEAWLFTNPTGKDTTEKINIKGWSEVEDLLGDKLEQKDDYINLAVKSLDVRILILKK